MGMLTWSGEVVFSSTVTSWETASAFMATKQYFNRKGSNF